MDGDSGSTTSLTAKESHEHRKVMKRILVKCADISNPCRPQKLCKEWAERIAEEYFAQTEDEKKMNLPVVFPDFDRRTCNLPVTQVNVDVFVLLCCYGTQPLHGIISQWSVLVLVLS